MQSHKMLIALLAFGVIASATTVSADSDKKDVEKLISKSPIALRYSGNKQWMVKVATPAVERGKKYRITFPLKNSTGSDLEFSNGSSQCTCLSASIDQSEVEVGKSTSMAVTIRVPSTFSGTVYQTSFDMPVTVDGEDSHRIGFGFIIPIANQLAFERPIFRFESGNEIEKVSIPFSTTIKNPLLSLSKETSAFLQLARIVKDGEKYSLEVEIPVKEMSANGEIGRVGLTDKVTGKTCSTKVQVVKPRDLRISPSVILFKPVEKNLVGKCLIRCRDFDDDGEFSVMVSHLNKVVDLDLNFIGEGIARVTLRLPIRNADAYERNRLNFTVVSKETHRQKISVDVSN